MMEEAEEDQYKTALDLADFPSSFSVLLNDVSCDWTEFESFLIAFPIVRSYGYPRAQSGQTCTTGTAYGGSH
jgi:hypothetical protein